MRSLVDDIASLLRIAAEDLPNVEPLEHDFAEVVKDDINIKNEMWQCTGLRKIHIEVAKTKYLEIIHSVFFPDPRYNLPIFGCDIIDTGKVVTAAIVDVSPVSGVNKFYSRIKPIADNFTDFDFRKLPEWGDIFSPHFKFMILHEEIERANYYFLLLNYLMEFTTEVKKAERGNMEETYKRYQDQVYYSEQQRKNPKTIAVLSKWFGEEWAMNYIENILFCKPKPMLTL